MELADAEVVKGRVKEQLEVSKRKRAEAISRLDAQEDRRTSLACEIQKLKSPEDYRLEMLACHDSLASKRKQLSEEQSLGSLLQSRLDELKRATESSTQLNTDISKLKQLRASVLTELATLERRHEANEPDPKSLIQTLQQQLQDAQDRFQYLCSRQMMMQ